jgi:ADP-dependent NAD(P)H-hydrate dehydratase / NAD(P)H-hydrate epimerase
MSDAAAAVQGEQLPADDPALDDPALDLDALAAHWAARDRLRPMTSEEMRGADARAQRMGMSGDRLMEQAGAAVAAAARALMRTAERPADAIALILCGPGNNGGDGLVAARRLAQASPSVRVACVLVCADERPTTPDAARNWDRLRGLPGVERIVARNAREVTVLRSGVERAGLVVDALLGTGIRGSLREPVRSAVELVEFARALGVPVLSVDTPTALDLTSGVASDPCVRADVTVTFHRPKEGLRMRSGRALAGRVLVAPIGIPSAADPT